LQHFVEFDTCTIAMLEKLLGARYFGGFIGPLIRHHATFFTSSSTLSLLFAVWTTTPTFWGVGHNCSCIFHSFPTG